MTDQESRSTNTEAPETIQNQDGGLTSTADSGLDDQSNSKSNRWLFFVIKIISGVVLFTLVTVCTMYSKLSLVSLTNQLRNVTFCQNQNVSDCYRNISKADRRLAVSLYWQLLLVITIPNFIGFFRSLFFGVLGKKTDMFPWPKPSSVVIGAIGAVLEVVAMSVFVFLVLVELPPNLSLLFLTGVFICQFLTDVYFVKVHTCCSGKLVSMYSSLCGSGCFKRCAYERVPSNDEALHQKTSEKVWANLKNLWKLFEYTCGKLLENRATKVMVALSQLGGVIAFSTVWYLFDEKEAKYLRAVIALPLCLLVISVIWCNKFQELIAQPKQSPQGNNNPNSKSVTARYKSGCINSAIRLSLYSFVPFIVFKFTTIHGIDPWCLPQYGSCDEQGIDFSGDTLSVFLVQIFTTLLAHIFAWIACAMTLGQFSMGWALLFSSPLSVGFYYLNRDHDIFPTFTNDTAFLDFTKFPSYILLLLGLLVWLGQLLGMFYYITTRKNFILSKDSDMFLCPSYDGIFFSEHMILNRQTNKYSKVASSTDIEQGQSIGATTPRKPRTVFICSTMYRESAEEMEQMLKSIKGMAQYHRIQKEENPDTHDNFESHIFFDGGLIGTQLQEFALQLLSLLNKTLGVMKDAKWFKCKTPYGIRLSFSNLGVDYMPFYIHFKDKNLVKPKKRWSQVMYMNYVIEHRVKNDPSLTAENTFILTTDADIDFTAKSAVVLLDMLETDPQVGAVCARTHPKGSGPLYWYQVFDYAIGHWFQKPAEHLLGCVLCSPGCFSVFRCSALQDVLETYSSLATNGMEFLMKDMGEDRWLCTLLIKEGWRLEYCAVSANKTYCPLSFREFWGQRRRWIPSTVANLSQLISGIWSIPRGNNSISVLFIFFQSVVLFSTAISPATVILVIASGLQSAFKLDDGIVIVILSLLIVISVIYGAICLFASQKVQISVAKILSFLLAIVMVMVVAGIVNDIISNIGDNGAFILQPTVNNCSLLDNEKDCENNQKYLENLPNMFLNEPFKLPVSTSVIYLGVFALTFLLAAAMHPTEFSSIFHSLWYLLALPSGYLLLLIYSAANLDSQSWGTREGSSGKDEGLLGWWKFLKKAYKKFTVCCRCYSAESQVFEESPEETQVPLLNRISPPGQAEHQPMKANAKEWLVNQGCNEYYIRIFEENGYTTKKYFAELTLKDLETIGIDKFGFRLRISKAASMLPSLPISVAVPKNVGIWLKNLEMKEYTGLFREEGFSGEADVENLKQLSEKELKAMGITKRAPLHRLMKAIHLLSYPNEVEQKMSETRIKIKSIVAANLPNEKKEIEFWEKLVNNELKPVSSKLESVEKLKQSLRSLRNNTLIALFLINVAWIIILFIIKVKQLADYGIDNRAFQLLFLAVYGFIIVIQFAAMVMHRVITLIHTYGRITPKELESRTSEDDFVVVEHMPSRSDGKGFELHESNQFSCTLSLSPIHNDIEQRAAVEEKSRGNISTKKLEVLADIEPVVKSETPV